MKQTFSTEIIVLFTFKSSICLKFSLGQLAKMITFSEERTQDGSLNNSSLIYFIHWSVTLSTLRHLHSLILLNDSNSYKNTEKIKTTQE